MEGHAGWVESKERSTHDSEGHARLEALRMVKKIKDQEMCVGVQLKEYPLPYLILFFPSQS